MVNAILLCVFLAGILSVAYGLWLYSRPAGFIFAGAAAIITTILYVRGSWVSSTG